MWQIKINLVFVTTIILFLPPAFSNVCTLPGCRKASNDILSFIDGSIDPCDDFYGFTCSGIFRKTFDEKPASLDEIVKKEMEDQTSLMLIKPIDPLEPKAIQAVKKFFRSCMDEAAVEKYGFTSIKRVLEMLGGWPVVEGENWKEDDFNFVELIMNLRKMGYNFIQLLYVRTTVDKEERHFLVDEPDVKPVKEKMKENYHDYMVNIAVLLGAEKKTASLELQETLLFKMKLLRLMSGNHQFNKTTMKNIQEKYPFINWKYLFENLISLEKAVIFDKEKIYVPSTDYLDNLQKLLGETSNRTLSNYIMWEAIEQLIPYLPKKFTDLRWEMYSKNTRQEDIPHFRIEYCKNLTSKVLRPTYAALYANKHFSLKKRENANKIVSPVNKELLNLLNVTDLYDDESREKMLKIAETLSYITGAPEKIFDEGILTEYYDALENITTNDLLTIASLLNRQSTNRAIKMGARFDEYHEYSEQTVSTSAYYSRDLNTVVLPAGMLQGLYFNETKPQYLNFGSLGTTLAYTLINAFVDGLYDGKWTETTKENYNKKTECLIKQARNFQIETSKLRMGGNKVLKDNVCGLTGVEIAYRAYMRWVEEHGEEKLLPGLTYTPKQLFWISTATVFCQTVRMEHLRDYIYNNTLAYPSFRVFGALSNNVHFAEDFKCPIGSKMNPAKKCKVF